jgi:hypothetical protein
VIGKARIVEIAASSTATIRKGVILFCAIDIYSMPVLHGSIALRRSSVGESAVQGNLASGMALGLLGPSSCGVGLAVCTPSALGGYVAADKVGATELQSVIYRGALRNGRVTTLENKVEQGIKLALGQQLSVGERTEGFVQEALDVGSEKILTDASVNGQRERVAEGSGDVAIVTPA